MTIAEKLDEFIRNNGDSVFIEAEGQPARLKRFFRDYYDICGDIVDFDTDGIRTLGDNVDKWGLELRLYLHYKPSFIKPTSNRSSYRGEYSYRINDKEIIMEMFELGYRIGLN